LDRNRLRRATLVRGFRLSRAAPFPCCGGASCSRRSPDGALGPPVTGRQEYGAAATPPPRRLPAGRTVLRGPSGAAFGWATRLQPDVAPVATAARQSTHPSVQQPHGDGRPRGTDRVGVRPRGTDFHEGGHRGGTTGAAKWCAGPGRPSDGDFRGNRRPGPATFRSLKLLVLRAPHRTPPCLSALTQHASAPRLGTPPSTALR